MNLSLKFKSLFKNPFFWFLLLFLCFGVYKNASINGYQNKTIISDGRGYYAYLPALFIYNDPTFLASLEAEKNQVNSENFSQYYLFKNEEGNYYNKYFPGVAVMQAPFFALATVATYVVGHRVTGYSNTYANFFYLGHLLYSIIGFSLFIACLQRIFPSFKNLKWKVILFIVSTPLFYYCLEIPLSHSYSFMLFGLFSYLILLLKEKFSLKRLVYLGLTLGMIFITRPTNGMIVLAIPLILGDYDSLVSFFKSLFSKKGKFLLAGVFSFSVVVFILFAIIKWQTGHWLYWPYSGEGFYWFSPELWQSLFSFRAGLFLQSPIMILAIIGLPFMYGKDRFKAIWWFIYFIITAYIISAWWCWDYASLFGSRPYTEHLFFLLIPILYLFDKFSKIVLIGIYPIAILAFLRYYQVTSEVFADQRFTSQNYFQSLKFWDKKNDNRWCFTESCTPFGELVSNELIADFKNETIVTEMEPYTHTVETNIGFDHLDKRVYVTVEMDKMVSEVPFNEVYVVIDGSSSVSDKRGYLTQPLFNDQYEAHNEWKHIVLSEFVQDNFAELDHLKIYLWNKSGRKFSVKNYTVTVQQYQVK